tara:strand:- start:379 stop:669 length:291 start_codon:yes stop_codon:yes gene_type:complete
MTHGGKRQGSGRPAGSPNKRSKEIQERLDAMDVDPIEGMAMIASDPTITPELKFQCFKELAQYVAPKRKSVDVSQTSVGDMTIEVVNFSDENKDST